jgi:hypothetical protein
VCSFSATTGSSEVSNHAFFASVLTAALARATKREIVFFILDEIDGKWDEKKARREKRKQQLPAARIYSSPHGA